MHFALCTFSPVAAQPAPSSPPKVEKYWLGLPSGQGGTARARVGAWAPVYVQLKPGKDGNGQNQFKLVLEANDREDNPYRYTVPVPALSAGQTDVVVFGYLRPGGDGEFVVSLQTVDGKVVQAVPRGLRAASAELVRENMPLFVAMGGASLTKLKASLQPKPPGEGEVADAVVEAGNLNSYARISSVQDMPDRWFGYDAADVVVLVTDNDDFMKTLLGNDAAPRRKALAEWVRRGGKLVLSTGRNYQMTASLLENMPLPEAAKMPLVSFEITGSVRRRSLGSVRTWANPQHAEALGVGSKDGVEVAKLARREGQPEASGLGEGTRVLVCEPPAPGDKDAEERPLIVQSSCGLGRVLFVAFDLDVAPFNTWDGQRAFWVKLREEITPKLLNPDRVNQWLNNFNGPDRPELADGLHRYLDSFEDVPVISFGWVALFIVVYIVLVGPVDYFILKKFFKRLELTWITFPTVVITISVGAYFLAYALKGDDLRVNKTDLVEIDLHTPQAYGTSWFSVFSPRIQNYTLSVEPALDGAGPAAPASTVVALMEESRSLGRGGSQSLFRQPYEFAPDAAGIERVPIPVWSTRTFTASWRAPFPQDKPPIRAELTRSRDGVVVGAVVNEMPVELQDVCLIYRNRWYKLELNGRPFPLAPNGGQFNVQQLSLGKNVESKDMNSWFQETGLLSGRNSITPHARRNDWRYNNTGQGDVSSHRIMKSLLFYRLDRETNELNSGLRPLDQNWRLGEGTTGYAPQKENPFRDEVILVARTAWVSGKAQKLNEESLVRLWNDELPAKGKSCPPLSGYLSQETYVRVYIPVRSQE